MWYPTFRRKYEINNVVVVNDLLEKEDVTPHYGENSICVLIKYYSRQRPDG